MSIALDGAAPIERFGRTWKPWTKRQVIDLCAKVPISKVEQVMLSYGDMIRFMGSIRGMDCSLAVAGGISEAEVETIGSIRERIKLAGDLMDRMIGEFSGESDEEPSPPLAVTVPTGG